MPRGYDCPDAVCIPNRRTITGKQTGTVRSDPLGILGGVAFGIGGIAITGAGLEYGAPVAIGFGVAVGLVGLVMVASGRAHTETRTWSRSEFVPDTDRTPDADRYRTDFDQPQPRSQPAHHEAHQSRGESQRGEQAQLSHMNPEGAGLIPIERGGNWMEDLYRQSQDNDEAYR